MEDPAEAVLSLQDVLEEDQQLEQTANAVLGPSDDTRCTYPKVSLHGVRLCSTLSWHDRLPTYSAGLCGQAGAVCLCYLLWHEGRHCNGSDRGEGRGRGEGGGRAGWCVLGLQSALP